VSPARRPRAQPVGVARRQPRHGPFLLACLLCERVIEEKDGSLTAVRLIDQIILEVPQLPPNAVEITPPLNMTLLVSIREGEPTHAYEVSIVVRDPSGASRRLDPPGQLLVAGVVAGGNFLAKFRFVPQQVGLYYFEVNLDGRFLSRVALDVIRRDSPAS
jgi:hypothetical protein